MEVKDWSYEEYPAYQNDDPEVKVIPSTGDEVFVRYLHDVVYDTVNGHDLHLQILVPETRNEQNGYVPVKPLPCVVWVKGSAWKKQYVYDSVTLGIKLASHGMVAAIVEYRGSDVATFPAPIVDTRNAIRYLRSHADMYRINPDQIFVGGGSSGGHTALYAGIFEGHPLDVTHYPGISAHVNGIIDCFGSVSVMAEDANPTTIDHCLPTSPEGLEMGGINLRENRAARQLLSIDCQITPELKVPPVLMFHGTKDRTVNPMQSVTLYRKLKACSKEATLYLIDGADHGGAAFETEKVIDLMVSFMEAHR